MPVFILAPLLIVGTVVFGILYSDGHSKTPVASESPATEQVSTPAPIEQPKPEVKNDTKEKVTPKPIVSSKSTASQPIAEATKKKKKGGTKKHDSDESSFDSSAYIFLISSPETSTNL